MTHAEELAAIAFECGHPAVKGLVHGHTRVEDECYQCNQEWPCDEVIRVGSILFASGVRAL